VRLVLVLLLLSCKPRVVVTDAGLEMPAGAVVNLSDMPPIPPPSGANYNWPKARMVLTEDGGWDLHCNGHCRAVGDGGVIEVRW
jgi:hypothetical protein